MLEGLTDMSRYNFGLSLPCEYNHDTAHKEIGLLLWLLI